MATLGAEYTDASSPVVMQSNPFVLDLTAPVVKLAASPPGFTPSDQGVSGPVTVVSDASSTHAAIDRWSLDILDPSGKLFRSQKPVRRPSGKPSSFAASMQRRRERVWLNTPLIALGKIDPAIMQHLEDIDGLIYADGALASAALQAGATQPEIAEALRVAYHLTGVGTLNTASQGLKDLA